jgi:hypothetical protein
LTLIKKYGILPGKERLNMKKFEILLARDVQQQIGVIAPFLRLKFSEAPWNEHKICPSCKKFDDYGPEHAWGKDAPAICPACGTITTDYWSDERTEHYLATLHPESFGAAIIANDQIAAWAWGRPESEQLYYLDTVAIIKERVAYIEALEAFVPFMNHLKQSGYIQMITRTHTDAKNIHMLLRGFGFTQGEISAEDPDRQYWVKNL